MSAYDPKRTSLFAPHMSAFGEKADITGLVAPLMLLPVLAAEASQTFDIEHRDHRYLDLDQPRFLQHLQSMIDRLPLTHQRDGLSSWLEISMRPSRLG